MGKTESKLASRTVLYKKGMRKDKMATYGNMDSFQLNGNKRVLFLQHIVRIELYFYANATENAAQQRLFSDCCLESILCA